MLSNGATIEDATAVRRFLAEQAVPYEFWDVTRLDGKGLLDAPTLGPSEQQAVLDAYSAELEELKANKGYLKADIVALWEQTPKLDELLKIFDREHYHTEDEVRFTIDGSGIFGVRSLGGEWFDVVVERGDLIIIPARRHHRFTLTDERRIKCIRVFQDEEGWKAIYPETEQAERSQAGV